MSINEIFFELIRVAIGTQDTLSRPPSKGEWAELYAMSKKQSLVGICFSAVQKLTNNQEPITHNLDEVQYLTWMGMAAKIQQRNEVVNRQCVELQTKLAADRFRSLILKGQGVASLYKLKAESGELIDLTVLRQSGDIDVWLDADAETTIKYVKSVAPTDDIERKHISLNVFDDTEVEVHWVPSELDNPFRNKQLRKWYNEQRESCFQNQIKIVGNEEEICMPTVEFNLVYLLLHIYEHFLYEGVGLRQLMDYYFVLRNMSDGFRCSNGFHEVQKTVHKLGLDRFASALMWVMQHVFGLGMIGVPWIPNMRDGKNLLEEIMDGGNFGKYGKDGAKGNETKLGWATRRMGRTMRLFRYEPIGALCRPFIRLRLAMWYKKLNNN